MAAFGFGFIQRKNFKINLNTRLENKRIITNLEVEVSITSIATYRKFQKTEQI